jgi:hypothetical protein
VKILKCKILGGLLFLLLSGCILFGSSVCGRTVFDDIASEASFGLETLKNMGKSAAEQSTEFLWKTVAREMHCSRGQSIDMKIKLEELARRGDQKAGDILRDLESRANQR